MLGLDVAVPAGSLEMSPGALGEEPRPFGAVTLENEQPLAVGAEPHAAQSPVDSARRDRPAFLGKPGGKLVRSEGRTREGKCQYPALVLGGESRRPAPGCRTPSRMHPVGPVALQPPLPAVVQRPGDAELPAGRADIDSLLRLTQHKKPKIMYTVREGHRDTSESLKLAYSKLSKGYPRWPSSCRGLRPRNV